MQNRPLKTILPGVSFASHKAPPIGSAAAAWRKVRGIAGVFTLVVSVVMLFGHLTTTAIDPLKSPELRVLKEKLRLNPADEQTKQQIRQLDLQLRGQYFRQLSRSASGVYLLLGGVAVFIIAATRCAAYRKQPPMPQARTVSPDPLAGAKAARWSVSAIGASVACVLLMAGFGRGTAVPEQAAAGQPLEASHLGAAAVPDAASDEELKGNWPRFRGPGGNGLSDATNLPVHWDTKSG